MVFLRLPVMNPYLFYCHVIILLSLKISVQSIYTFLDPFAIAGYNRKTTSFLAYLLSKPFLFINLVYSRVDSFNHMGSPGAFHRPIYRNGIIAYLLTKTSPGFPERSLVFPSPQSPTTEAKVCFVPHAKT